MAAALGVASAPAGAQAAYPVKPIRLVESVPRRGYTLLYTAQNTVAINPHVFKTLPYKVEDFVPVVRVATLPLVLIVAANSPIKSLSDLIRVAKERPGKLNFASYGIGQGTHVAMVRLLNAAAVTMNHVPCKDGGIGDVMNGTVDVSFEATTTAIPQIKGGKLRALAISSAKRSEVLRARARLSCVLTSGGNAFCKERSRPFLALSGGCEVGASYLNGARSRSDREAFTLR